MNDLSENVYFLGFLHGWIDFYFVPVFFRSVIFICLKKKHFYFFVEIFSFLFVLTEFLTDC